MSRLLESKVITEKLVLAKTAIFKAFDLWGLNHKPQVKSKSVNNPEIALILAPTGVRATLVPTGGGADNRPLEISKTKQARDKR